MFVHAVNEDLKFVYICIWIEVSSLVGSNRMEIECDMNTQNQKLEALAIFRKALTTSASINFFLITTIASLPLFGFLVYYQPFQQKFQVEFSEILKEPGFEYFFSDYFWDSFPIVITPQWSKGFPDELIQLALLYLVPLHLEVITALAISSLASKIYKEETQMTLKEMVQNHPFDKTRLKASLITSTYVLILSTCSVLLRLIWAAASYYFVLRYFLHGVLLSLWCLVACVALLALYLAWNAIWNLSILISILEGIHGTKAFGLAIWVSFGNEWAGFLLMLIFIAWEICLRLPCLLFGCKERWHVMYVAEISLLCFGNVLKWVVFIIYFHDCKKWILEKRLMIKAKNSADEQNCV